LEGEAQFLPEYGMQPIAELSLEDRARKVASDIERAKELRLAKKAAIQEKIQAARDKKNGVARKPTGKQNRETDHAKQLHELSRASKEPASSHPFLSLSEQAERAGPNRPVDGSKVLLLSRQWQLLVARVVAYAVDVEPQPLEEEDLKKDFMVQVFWDNLVDRKHANYWPENTEHLWMGPRMKRLQYVASLPGEMLKTVKQWRGSVEVLAANEGMDDHVSALSAGNVDRESAGKEDTPDESVEVEAAKPSLLSGLVSRFRGNAAQKDAVPF
jgi:hypothetical protein